MAEDLHAILGANADEKLAIAAELARSDGSRAIEVADVAEHLAPLTRQKIHHIYPFTFTFEQSSLRTLKMHVCICCHPPFLSPVQYTINLKPNPICIWSNCNLLANRRNLISFTNVYIHITNRQISNAFT